MAGTTRGRRGRVMGKPKSSDVTIGVTVTVHVAPNAENIGTYSVAVAIDGPETVVAMIRAAYERGRLNHGIEAFVAAALSPIADPRHASPSRPTGRA